MTALVLIQLPVSIVFTCGCSHSCCRDLLSITSDLIDPFRRDAARQTQHAPFEIQILFAFLVELETYSGFVMLNDDTSTYRTPAPVTGCPACRTVPLKTTPTPAFGCRVKAGCASPARAPCELIGSVGSDQNAVPPPSNVSLGLSRTLRVRAC